MERIKIKILKRGAYIPSKASEGAAGYDIYCAEDCEIRPGRQVVGTGIAIELPQGYQAEIRPRSGYSAKGFATAYGNRADADVVLGTIDADYRGEVGVIIDNHEDVSFRIKAGQRIAQMVISKYESPVFDEVAELSDSERGEGGFNSTGI